MQAEIRTQNVRLSEALRDYIDRRLGLVLGRFAPRLRRLTVRLTDLNGPRGGVDKSCRLSASLIPQGKVLVSTTDVSLHAALDRAVERLDRALVRALKRRYAVNGRRESVRRWFRARGRRAVRSA
ncbi:MAG TPA: HPF/RaiA family ribosome-associated protein [Terriglobia bacterium]|jgi:ribosomal subunit interface protein|nr:HPF/RaiA family ribosome-associated protein [Terriglobia bacterium]